MGTVGVDLFFVLSGYLIGGLILKQINSGRTAFRDFMYFWVRRWFRTLPNYFLILILNVALFYFLYGTFVKGTTYYFVFLQNFADPHPDFFTEAWSLSIEEFAYIIGPLLLFFLLWLKKATSKGTLYLAAVILIITIAVLFRIYYQYTAGSDTLESWSANLRKVVIYRIDSIYYGFIGAYMASYYVVIWSRYKYQFLWLGLVLFIGMHLPIFLNSITPSSHPFFYNILYLPLMSLSLLLFFPMFSAWKIGHRLKFTITYTSILSYGVYLLNYSIVLLTIQHFVDMDDVSVLAKILILFGYWFLTFYLAHLLYTYFEKPLMDIRDSNYIKRLFL
jgi:peptidoglycan/LPS O-acetylase OafA/YrhL